MENKRIRMTVEIAVNEEMLKKTGVSFDDVLNGIRFNEHDAVDGFEITADVPGYDCSSDFFLVSGDVISIEEVETPNVNRLDRINAYKGNEEFLKATAEQKVQDETIALVAQIRALKPRIDELLEVGNACLENGIELDAYHHNRGFNRSEDCYERGTFVTNSISHRVGFVINAGKYDVKPLELGINNGGACGCYDFRTDGARVYFVHEKNKLDTKDASYKLSDLRAFLNKFDDFESSFYSYIDKVVEKQQSQVDKIIADAKGRVQDAPAGAGERELDI